MNSALTTVRELAGKNAVLLAHAADVRERLRSAAEMECARLSGLIDSVSPTDVLTDDSKAERYQSWVMQRAGLLRMLADESR